jgi:hypothetical protein
MKILLNIVISSIIIILALIIYRSVTSKKMFIDDKNLIKVKPSIINKKTYFKYLKKYKIKKFKNNDTTTT